MANQYVDTGHGSTLTFGTSSYSFNVTAIDPGQAVRNAIPASHLGTTGQMEFKPGDLEDAGEITVDFQFDTGNAAPVTSTAAETVTITFPTTTGQATPATLAGTAIITTRKMPPLQSEQLQMGQMVIKWDGYTGPTFTPATE